MAQFAIQSSTLDTRVESVEQVKQNDQLKNN